MRQIGRFNRGNAVQSPLPYIGGKSKLAETIIRMIPEHQAYCEAFAGAAWVLFRKEPSRYETINDLDSDLVGFYRVLQHHLEEFLRQFKWLLSSREWFNDFKRQQAAGGLTDIQRAARYYYLQRLSFGGKVKGRAFGSNPLGYPRINLVRMEEELSAIHLRLTRVTIENQPWRTFIERFDRPETFFYLDPPYWKAPVYKHNLELKDYQEMAEVLVGIRGKFIWSINDAPEIRQIASGFRVKPVEIKYTAGAHSNKTVGKELLISNF